MEGAGDMCTGVRFADEDGNMYLGRNLDWSFSYGEKIVVTPRGYRRVFYCERSEPPICEATLLTPLIPRFLPFPVIHPL